MIGTAGTDRRAVDDAWQTILSRVGQRALHFSDPSNLRSPLRLLQRVWAAALITLLALSWRLWMPASRLWGTDFPPVPLITIAAPLAWAIELASAAGLLASLVIILARRRIAWQPFAITLICFSALFLTNQHRLQPWAYQGWLYAWIFVAMTPTAARRGLIALAISIYAYSALGKFDQQFLNTVGPDFVAALMPWLDRASESTARNLAAAALALPIMELGLAILLAVPPCRRTAGYAAIIMHAVLVMILGPLGLRHSPAVIAWNVFLAIQAWLLFIRLQPDVRPSGVSEESKYKTLPRLAKRVAVLILLAALGLPLLERRGYWDHWLSWSLYSPHTSRVDIQFHRSAIDSLPPAAIGFIRPSKEQDTWYDLAIDRWSLADLAVPVYPQARFQLGVASSLAHKLASPDAIRIRIRGVADRRSGRRQETWLIGRDPIDDEAKHYWFLPRR